MFSTGYYTIGRFKGAPIRIHWSAPLGALFFGGFAFRPGFWLGFFVVIILHELGHAVVVKAVRQHVAGIDVIALGGVCKWSGPVTSIQRALIAWGGVWAQMLLFAAAQITLFFWAPPTAFFADLAVVLTTTNLWLMALNLLPFRPLDGAEAWPLFKHLWADYRLRKSLRDIPPPASKGPPKSTESAEPKYSDRVRDPDQSEDYFNRLMNNSVVKEEDQER